MEKFQEDKINPIRRLLLVSGLGALFGLQAACNSGTGTTSSGSASEELGASGSYSCS